MVEPADSKNRYEYLTMVVSLDGIGQEIDAPWEAELLLRQVDRLPRPLRGALRRLLGESDGFQPSCVTEISRKNGVVQR